MFRLHFMGNFVSTRKTFPDAQKLSGWQCLLLLKHNWLVISTNNVNVIFTSSLFSGRWPWSVWCWRGSPASSSLSLATSLSSCFQFASSALASPSLTPPSSPCSGSSWTRSTPLSMAPSMPSQIYPTVQVPPSFYILHDHKIVKSVSWNIACVVTAHF